MDTSAFLSHLTAVFPGDPQDTDPVDPSWTAMTDEVAGYTGPNELAVLQAAAAVLPDGEAYLEVGTYKGRSVCAAAQGNADKTFYAMENFLEFGMTGQQARDELMGNLERHAGGANVHLLEGDCFTLMADRSVIDRPVGVYFYDGEHTLLSHYLALAVAEPLLADEALVLVDDASWPLVQRAHRLFLKRHPGWQVVATWDAREANDPRWANGLHALVFRRPSSRHAQRLSRTDEVLRIYQTRVQDRLNTVAWKAADRFPGFFKGAAKVVLSRSRAIGDDER
ncbi:class I SAM-dependent methyltransferase [Leekyejoonella antrihumi]|uniref:Class I SAM-dependent methyltransferase n=1 Tax=Leekyejoonella antrihumi TaxID=1660198 RepID=A0A563E3Y4_9MICO|nr:class I SAM-dependent methyltransferase [Leekyejoonella antrihumi]TWP37125.1 class I SAM-dependent methyltransferase [Leekyejoonella antrihumi]